MSPLTDAGIEQDEPLQLWVVTNDETVHSVPLRGYVQVPTLSVNPVRSVATAVWLPVVSNIKLAGLVLKGGELSTHASVPPITLKVSSTRLILISPEAGSGAASTFTETVS